MKIALVHDQLQEFGGAERVLVALHSLFPQADVYTAFFDRSRLGIHAEKFDGWNIYTSWANKIPFLKKFYSPLRFITPKIWERFDLSSYDLVISSSGSYMCKGVITKGKTLHVCYLHHPPRYLYNYETGSLNELQKYTLFRIYANWVNHPLRMWDYISSQRPHFFIANSYETKRRIQKFYRRNAHVIYPPVHVSQTKQKPSNKKSYYITVSRLQYAKHVDLLVKAAKKGKFNLKVIGVGRDLERLKKLADSHVEFLSSVPDQEFETLYAGAKAFLFASVDDEFGIAPIEAMGRGVPVIAYASGGLKETVQDKNNGYLYEVFSENAIIEKIKKLENLSPSEYKAMSETARKSAKQYSYEEFKKNIVAFLESKGVR